MNQDRHSISIRLDPRLHAELKELAEVHPLHSMTAVIKGMIVSGLSHGSTVRPRIYFEAAVANLAVILDLLRRDSRDGRDGRVDPEVLELVQHFYGMLLEMTISIEGVEP